MRGLRRILVITLALLALVTPGLALSDPTPEELEQNRRLLDRWRNDPEHYGRLQRDLRAFLALPAAQQARLRQLHHDLRQEESGTQARLFRVLERYADWLERLPRADRQRLDAAPNARERLQLIRRIREREWQDRLPTAVRERLLQLPEAERPAEVARLRREEQQNRAEWQTAFRHWEDTIPRRPLRVADLPTEVQNFVNNQLLPALSAPDSDLFKKAEGQPNFCRVLLDLIRKQRGLRGTAPTLRYLREQLGIGGPQSPLAAGDTLPDVPDRILLDFALTELTSAERAKLNLSFSDPTSRVRLKEEYFQRHPRELQQLRQIDSKQKRKAKNRP